jgi:hypothetical protein
MAHSDQRQFLVSIDGIAGGFWAQLSGGDLSVPTTKSFDGGNPVPQVLTGNPTVDDLVCTRPYDPTRDGPVAQALKQGIARGAPFTTTISQDPTDPGYSPLGTPPDVWRGVLSKVTTPKADASKTGANAATFALTFTCTSLT